MAKIKFCGAAQTVTGSSHLLTLDDGTNILLDCGLYQGYEDKYENFNREWMYDPASIDYMILSHAHIDHSGRIPKLCKDGFEGDIICTSATRDLAAIMLLDSAFIQEKDVIYENKSRERRGLKPVDPLYTGIDARNCMDQFIGIGYNRWYKIREDIAVRFRDSGHILGSASVTLRITMPGGYDKFIAFTGDIGRPDRPILRDPQPLDDVDYLICESTYGGKEHGGAPNNRQQLLEVIQRTCVDDKGKLIIPAFSVGRTQEIVYMLDQLENEKKLPKIPVFVDSPLAVNATDIFTMHPECFDEEIVEYMDHDPNPFGFNNLKYVRSVEQSKAINNLKGPAIIISASGMMTAGRVKHHLANNIENPANCVLVVGYCSPGTLGGRLRDGDEEVRIYGNFYKVKARVEILDSFSAHGDQPEMLAYLDNLNRHKLKNLFLVHGELDRQELFKQALEEKKFRNIEIPHFGQTYNLELS
ncbi:MAG: MBL fold metallo-hydrolase [Flavobacteriales bacterium]|nr:MBL fold metallo-hydrolase [Bacteroidota bacterium]MCB9240533.1 MBL fold metallo-hydrolase [Flavobacteriales bacterium]